jgi:hypothetical protein
MNLREFLLMWSGLTIIGLLLMKLAYPFIGFNVETVSGGIIVICASCVLACLFTKGDL